LCAGFEIVVVVVGVMIPCRALAFNFLPIVGIFGRVEGKETTGQSRAGAGARADEQSNYFGSKFGARLGLGVRKSTLISIFEHLLQSP
jgi:hypothetical protein